VKINDDNADTMELLIISGLIALIVVCVTVAIVVGVVWG
jgi:hypothetical protein